MIALFRLFEKFEIIVKLLLGCKSGALDSCEHLIVFVVFPVCARLPHNLERFKSLRVCEVRAYAHVDVFTLLIEGDDCVLVKVADMFDFIFFSSLFHQCNSLFARKRKRLDWQILFDDFLHFRLDAGKVIVGEFGFAEVYVVVKTFFVCGAVGKVCFGEKTLDCLRHDVCGGVTNHVQFFLLVRDFSDRAVVIDNFHKTLLL